jgi:hypothetical protein
MRTIFAVFALAIGCRFVAVAQEMNFKTCAPEPGTTDIEYGEVANCDVGFPGDADLFRFYGRAGQKVWILVARTSGNADHRLRIIDTDGAASGYTTTRCYSPSPYNLTCPAHLYYETTLSKTGSYLVEVSDNGSNETFSYSIGLKLLVPLPTDSIQLEYGRPRQSKLKSSWDWHYYTIGGTAGDRVKITVTRTSDNANHWLTVVAPSGKLVYDNGAYCYSPSPYNLTCSAEVSTESVLDETGAYVLRLRDGNEDETFAYTIVANCIGNCAEAPSVSFANALRVAQIADGGSWKTSFQIVNSHTSPVSYSIRFWDDAGNPLTLPLVNGLAGTNGTLSVGGTAFAESPGAAAALIQGWAEVASSGPIGVLAVFRQQVPGRPDSEGTVTAVRSGDRVFLPFDNTNGYVTGVAVANTNSTQPLLISLLFQMDNGNQATGTLALPAHAHTAFVLSAKFPVLLGMRGSVRFTAPTADIALVGLRFSPTGSFTSLGQFQ